MIDLTQFKAVIRRQVKALLKTKGMAQRQLAEKIDISPQSLSMILKGDRPLTIDRFVKIANALDVPVDTLLDGTRYEGSSISSDKEVLLKRAQRNPDANYEREYLLEQLNLLPEEQLQKLGQLVRMLFGVASSNSESD